MPATVPPLAALSPLLRSLSSNARCPPNPYGHAGRAAHRETPALQCPAGIAFAKAAYRGKHGHAPQLTLLSGAAQSDHPQRQSGFCRARSDKCNRTILDDSVARASLDQTDESDTANRVYLRSSEEYAQYRRHRLKTERSHPAVQPLTYDESLRGRLSLSWLMLSLRSSPS